MQVVADAAHAGQFVVIHGTLLQNFKVVSHLVEVSGAGHTHVYCGIRKDKAVAFSGCRRGFAGWHPFGIQKLAPGRRRKADDPCPVFVGQEREHLSLCSAVDGAIAEVANIERYIVADLWEEKPVVAYERDCVWCFTCEINCPAQCINVIPQMPGQPVNPF